MYFSEICAVSHVGILSSDCHFTYVPKKRVENSIGKECYC